MTEYAPGDVAYHIDSLRQEGELLAAAADRAGLPAVVPGCPGWQVADLLRHVGYVHRWATGFVRDRLESPVSRLSEPEILRNGPSDGSLPGWFADGHAALVDALAAADPGLACWTFLAAPSPLAFWARRQAHETAVHRVDAQQAAGSAGPQPPPEPRFAADGIDEMIMAFGGRAAGHGRWRGPAGALGVHADDGQAGRADWLVANGPDGASVTRGTGSADCDVTGPAADIYLLLWNRGQADAVTVTGNPGMLAGAREALRVKWG
jgi:uncharacterized protein (TIGR03083 family)